MIVPSGQWYFTGQRPSHNDLDDPIWGVVNPDENGTDYTNYPEHTDPATFGPCFAAFAMAVQSMPVLEHFKLNSELARNKGRFAIFYYAPGGDGWEAEWANESDEDLLFSRVYYDVGPGSRPDEEIRQGLRCAGKEKFG